MTPVAKLDKFSERVLPRITKRFLAERDAVERAAALIRLGMLCGFSDFELRVLAHTGYLCQADRIALVRVGRKNPFRGAA